MGKQSTAYLGHAGTDFCSNGGGGDSVVAVQHAAAVLGHTNLIQLVGARLRVPSAASD